VPVDVDAAAEALTSFEATWGERYPMIGKTWHDTWEHVLPFLAFPTDMRRASNFEATARLSQ
jgi:putative transposase